MSMVGATGYWHTGVTVRDARRTADYLRDVLGLAIAEPVMIAKATAATITGVPAESLQAIFATGNGISIELLEYSTSDRNAPVTAVPDQIGNMHLAFMVDDLDRVLAEGEPWGRRLVAGIVAPTLGPRKGWRICYTIDDDGLLIEFAQPA